MVMFADFIIHASLTIPISPANIYTPEIIKTGWFFTIGFVNMFFALALTFIGLATILGIKDYEAKKLLPKLLFIAILVNFTPVIIGFIVDMGNLVTNVFVEATTFNISTLIAQVGDLFLIDKLVIFFRDSISNITGDFEVTLFSAINLEIQLFISFIYLWGAAFVWSCIAGMFVLRIVMLWILTILSPIAFFSFIVPDGSPFQMLFPDVLSWKKWWEEFLKWVIVGIPFGLFLYISQGMIAGGLSFTENVALEAGSLEGIDFKELVGNLIENSLVNITALILLYQGYQISL
nr:hypothetical protein [Nanoarchaeota archaeon]